MAVIRIENHSELVSKLEALNDGDQVIISPGEYDRKNEDPIAISANFIQLFSEGATFLHTGTKDTFNLTGIQQRFAGLHRRNGTKTGARLFRIFAGCFNPSFVNCTTDGAAFLQSDVDAVGTSFGTLYMVLCNGLNSTIDAVKLQGFDGANISFGDFKGNNNDGIKCNVGPCKRGIVTFCNFDNNGDDHFDLFGGGSYWEVTHCRFVGGGSSYKNAGGDVSGFAENVQGAWIQNNTFVNSRITLFGAWSPQKYMRDTYDGLAATYTINHNWNLDGSEFITVRVYDENGDEVTSGFTIADGVDTDNVLVDFGAAPGATRYFVVTPFKEAVNFVEETILSGATSYTVNHQLRGKDFEIFLRLKADLTLEYPKRTSAANRQEPDPKIEANPDISSIVYDNDNNVTVNFAAATAADYYITIVRRADGMRNVNILFTEFLGMDRTCLVSNGAVQFRFNDNTVKMSNYQWAIDSRQPFIGCEIKRNRFYTDINYFVDTPAGLGTYWITFADHTANNQFGVPFNKSDSAATPVTGLGHCDIESNIFYGGRRVLDLPGNGSYLVRNNLASDLFDAITNHGMNSYADGTVTGGGREVVYENNNLEDQTFVIS